MIGGDWCLLIGGDWCVVCGLLIVGDYQ